MPRDLVSVGSAIVDRYYRLSNLPEPDGGAFVRDAWEGFGGVAANVACAAARLGRDVGIVTRLGSDGDAETVVENLRGWGVDTTHVQYGEEPSTYSIVLRDPAGERMIITGGEAARSLSLPEVDLSYAREARTVFTNGYVPDRVVAPLVAARSEGNLPPLAFDLAGPLAELESRGTTPETVGAAVRNADLFVADVVALRAYLEHHDVPFDPRDTDRLVPWFRDRDVRRAALTFGADGALLLTPETVVEVPAFDVDVVDATGAGDAFVAGLLDAWLLDGCNPTEAGRHAAAVAALNCTGDGARGGLPTREEVARFREEREE